MRQAERLCREHALYPPDASTPLTLDARAYLQALPDGYSTYLSRDELDRLAEFDQPDYAGVGMEVVRAAGRGNFCVPYDNGPARLAGLLPGDRLLTVDGRNVADAAPESLPVLVRGKAGTAVTLTVAGPDGRERNLTVTRAAVSRPVVESRLEGGVLKIRIYRFTHEVPELVNESLAQNPDAAKVVIDLRSNIGGEFWAAVGAAALFLPEEATVASIIGRDGAERLVEAGFSPKHFGRRVVIWQDHLSASASEIFIAALTHNGAAVSIGRRTFGKGLMQEQFPALDGGLFIITTSELRPPDGLPFHGQGLAPYYSLRSNTSSDADYEARTKDVFSR
jgi:carboxyl-terminal processing protease